MGHRNPVPSRALHIAALAALVAFCVAIALPIVVLTVYGHGRTGFTFDGRTVLSVAPGSPAAIAGLRRGDHLPADVSLYDKMRIVRPLQPRGERLTFDVERSGRTVAIVLQTAPKNLEPIGGILILTRLLGYLAIVGVGALLVVSRPGRMSWGFALYSCAVLGPNGLTDAVAFMLWPDAALVAVPALEVLQNVGFYGLLVFAVRFPTNADPTGWRRKVDRLAPFAAALSAILALNQFFGFVFDYSVAWYGWLYTWEPIVVSLGALAILVANARAATNADVRRRLWWVIAGLGAGFVAYSFNIALNDSGHQAAARVFANLQVVVAVAIAYGALRREVIDVRVVLDRALTYSVTTAAAVGVFAFAYWLVGRALAASQAALAVQILAALLIGAGLHRLHRIVDRNIGTLVFAHVRRTEERLARIARALDECENSVALGAFLLDESAAAVDSNAAILYERRGDGTYACVRALGSVDGDRAVAPPAALVTHAAALRSTAPFGYEGRLVLPVCVGSALFGLVVYEDRDDGAELDERERSALAAVGEAAGRAFVRLRARDFELAVLTDLVEAAIDVPVDRLNDYVVDRIAALLPERDRSLLIACASLPSVDANDLRSVLGIEGLDGMLDRLHYPGRLLRVDVRGIVTCDDRVARRLRRQFPDAVAAVVRRFAHAYLDRSDFVQAAALYRSLHDHDAAAAALEPSARAQLRDDALFADAELTKAVAELPPAAVASYPALAWLAALASDADAGFLDRLCAIHARLAVDDELRPVFAGIVSVVGAATADSPVAHRHLPGAMASLARCARALLLARDGRPGEAAEALLTARGPDAPVPELDWFVQAEIATASGEFERGRVLAAAIAERGNVPAALRQLAAAMASWCAWLGGDDEAMRGRVPVDAVRAALFRACDSADYGIARGAARSAADAAAAAGARLEHVLATLALAALEAPLVREHARRAFEAADGGAVTALGAAVRAFVSGADELAFLAPFAARARRPRTSPAAPLAVYVCAGIAVRGTAEIALSDRELAVLMALARAPRVMSSAELTDAIWPDLDETQASKALQTAVYRLRLKLHEADVVANTAHGYRLRDGTYVDLGDFERAARAFADGTARTEVDRCVLLAAARRLALPRPEAMQLWEWFAPVDRRIRDLAQTIRCVLADEYLRLDEPPAALALARDAIEADEFDERARTLAIRALLAGGDEAAGVREYRRYRDFLRTELDVEPPAELRHLLEDAVDHTAIRR